MPRHVEELLQASTRLVMTALESLKTYGLTLLPPGAKARNDSRRGGWLSPGARNPVTCRVNRRIRQRFLRILLSRGNTLCHNPVPVPSFAHLDRE